MNGWRAISCVESCRLFGKKSLTLSPQSASFLHRAFGPYLSSMVLVCISIDRYFAVIHPLKVNDAHRRSKIMLTFAWLTSIVCSVPQVLNSNRTLFDC